MQHIPVSQTVIRPRARVSSCVRFPRAASPDAALATLIRMHVPSEWR